MSESGLKVLCVSGETKHNISISNLAQARARKQQVPAKHQRLGLGFQGLWRWGFGVV